MPEPVVTVVIPTLTAGTVLTECLLSLKNQTFRDFDVIVVDNSGEGRARGCPASDSVRVIENKRNLGFGAAVNQGMRASRTGYLATLNDDAAAHPGWLAALVSAAESRPEMGMCASQVRLAGEDLLDSAGMLISADGSSKQRGHRLQVGSFPKTEEVLLPSGSAALYRREMLDEIGGFDEDFFLYSEDTDLGLRARWAGWKCLYAAEAVVDHLYSHSAGRASSLKACYVERNRLFLIVKNFPARLLARAPIAALARYFWHAVFLVQGRGAAAHFRSEGGSGWKLPLYVVKAHLVLLAHLPELWRKRRAIRRGAKIDSGEFARLLAQHGIRPREVAAL